MNNEQPTCLDEQPTVCLKWRRTWIQSPNTISMGPLGMRPCSQLSVVNQLCMVINCIESWRDELQTQSVFSDIADATLLISCNANYCP